MLVRFIPAALLLLAVAPAASAQSFDCGKARTRVEKMVCADREVADLDEYLGRYYAGARAAIPGAESCLRSDQAEWLKTKRDACADSACLKTVYLDRLAELDPLQPGVTALKNVSLPKVASLVWVIPPASDKVAAPPNPRAQPYEATGSVIDDIASNPKSDGISLRTTDGTTIPLMLLMFLESPTQEHLAGLAKEKGATFRARGFVTGEKRLVFEPSRCVFLHRLP